jgi:hypothetical protein
MKGNKPSFESDQDLAEVVTGHGPCTYLLLALIALILLFPYARTDISGRIGLATLFSLVLVSGAYAIGRSPRTLIVGMSLAVVGVALQWTSLLTDIVAFARLAGLVYVIFLLVTIGEVLRYLLKKGPVTADKLHGALAGYIMLAFLWTFIYVFIENFTPGSFNFTGSTSHDPHAFYHLLYFSFTTLTTVGYGDITPATDQARSFVMIEQFAGVFFVGVLIARLAGLYPAPEQGKPDAEP